MRQDQFRDAHPAGRISKAGRSTTIGDDIAWMKSGDGRLYAINPEAGYFGVAPGTNFKSNPNAMRSIAARHDLHQRRAYARWRRVVGRQGWRAARRMLDWRGNRLDAGFEEKAAHPNSRFTAPMRNNPVLAPEVDEPAKACRSARSSSAAAAATRCRWSSQAFNWIHGVYLGATMGSEMTAAAAGAVGQVRRDPMAMLPFCGYHMGDYFNHWLDIRKRLTDPPRIFNVNWFRKGRRRKIPLARVSAKTCAC